MCCCYAGHLWRGLISVAGAHDERVPCEPGKPRVEDSRIDARVWRVERAAE
jgi:hypothetical protein